MEIKTKELVIISKTNENSNLKVVLFISRNKDNHDVPSFKARKKSFLTTKPSDDPELLADFKSFVTSGLPGELSRLYVSVNSRNPKKVNQSFMHYLLDTSDLNPATYPQKVASLAAKKENAFENKWLFDFDYDDEQKLNIFLSDLKSESNLKDDEVCVTKTITGYAVVVSHGFNTQNLLNNWVDVTLKRDDMLLVNYSNKF